MQAVGLSVHSLGQGVAQVHLVLEEEARCGRTWCRGYIGLILEDNKRSLILRAFTKLFFKSLPDDDAFQVHVARTADPDPNSHYWNWAWSHSTGCRKSHCPRAASLPCNRDPSDPGPSTCPVAVAVVAGASAADGPGMHCGLYRARNVSWRNVRVLREAGACHAWRLRPRRPLNSDCSSCGPRASHAGDCAASCPRYCSNCSASCPFPVKSLGSPAPCSPSASACASARQDLWGSVQFSGGR